MSTAPNLVRYIIASVLIVLWLNTQWWSVSATAFADWVTAEQTVTARSGETAGQFTDADSLYLLTVID